MISVIISDYVLHIPRKFFSEVKSSFRSAVDPQEQRIKDSISYFMSLKNLYHGRRGFVIGNGPSLRMADLDLLKNEITIASNKIFLAFPHVEWRPTIYTVADPLLWEKIEQEIPDEVGMIHLPQYIDPASSSGRNIKTWRVLSPPAGETREKDNSFSGVEFSSDLCIGMYGSWTVTFDNLQFAAHLGLSPIYIIGCDHYYAEELDIEQNKPVLAGNVNNHFIANYRQPGELVNPAPIKLMERGYAEARIFSDRTGIGIFNASRGGFLETFHRVDFESLFCI